MAQFIVQDYSAPRFQGFAAYPSAFLEVDVEVEEGGVSVGGGCKRVWVRDLEIYILIYLHSFKPKLMIMKFRIQ